VRVKLLAQDAELYVFAENGTGSPRSVAFAGSR